MAKEQFLNDSGGGTRELRGILDNNNRLVSKGQAASRRMHRRDVNPHIVRCSSARGFAEQGGDSGIRRGIYIPAIRTGGCQAGDIPGRASRLQGNVRGSEERIVYRG
ncbi:MAG: hypothetical protein NVS4B3_22670 [Gemmatimonadaceae bacterium]